MGAKTIYFQDESVYRDAVFYAKKLNTNISRLVEVYLKSLVQKKKKKKVYLTDKLVLGPVKKLPKNFNYKNEIAKIIEEKYELGKYSRK